MKTGKLLTLTALATGITLGAFVDSAEAFPFGSRRFPNPFGINFELGDSNEEQSIQKFEIVDSAETPVAKSESSFSLIVEPLDITISELITNAGDPYDYSAYNNQCERSSDSLQIDSVIFPSCFSNINVIEGDIYQFSFDFDEEDIILTDNIRVNIEEEDTELFVEIFDNEGNEILSNLVSNIDFEKGESREMIEMKIVEAILNDTQPIIQDRDEYEVTWFVPSVFTYLDENFDSEPFSTVDEKSLGAILNQAASKNISEILFPAEFQEDGFEDTSLISFSTQSQTQPPNTVPESSAVYSLLGLGILGGFAMWKRRKN